MGGIKNRERAEAVDASCARRARHSRERRHGGGLVARRAAVGRAIGRHRLEDFQKTLTGLAVGVFGNRPPSSPTCETHRAESGSPSWSTRRPNVGHAVRGFCPARARVLDRLFATDKAGRRTVPRGNSASSRMVPSGGHRAALLDAAASGRAHLTLKWPRPTCRVRASVATAGPVALVPPPGRQSDPEVQPPFGQRRRRDRVTDVESGSRPTRARRRQAEAEPEDPDVRVLAPGRDRFPAG